MEISRRQFLVGAGAAALSLALPACEVEIPGNKRLRVIFNFGSHQNLEDANKISPLVRRFKPHVVAQEMALETERSAREAEDKTMNGQRAEGVNEFLEGVLRIARRAGAKLYVLERNSESMVYAEKQRNRTAEQLLYAAYGAFLQGDPNGALQYYKHSLEITSSVQAKREQVITQRLSNLYENLLKRYPELSKKKELRVIVNYGAAHTPIYRHALGSGYGSVSRRVATPVYFDPEATFRRRITFGLPYNLTDEAIARMFLGRVINITLNNLGIDQNNSGALATHFSNRATLEQFRTFCHSFRGTAVGQIEPLRQAMQLAGLGNLPRSDQEARAIMGRKFGAKRLRSE